MVGTGTPENQAPPGPSLAPPLAPDFNANGNHWGWQPRRGMRGFPPGPRRGMYMRGGFFPGPRGYRIFPQPLVFNQRKSRPDWNPRNPRLPHFPVQPVDGYLPYQPPWPTAPQPAPPPAAEGETEPEEPPPKKKKRTTNGTSRPWNREAAEKALQLEIECQKNAGANAIVIRFPDPELSKEIVQKFHPAIENVHFQAPCGGRYCFVTLKEDAHVDKVMTTINQIKFGVGTLQAERKVQKTEENVGPENIDPFTLYVGNLPTNISTVEVKEKFPTATRIDVGYAQKMKYTRYAFVRYSTSEAALEAYKSSVNTIIASRSIILRFRRHKAPVGPPGEKPAPCIIEAKPGEKLTVGAKLKAKKDKAKAEKAAKEKETKSKGKKKKEQETAKKTGTQEGSSDDEEVELENDDSDSDDDTEDEDDDDDDDDDDPDDDDDDEDDDDVDDEDNDDDDDDDDDLDANIQDDDDDYMDDEDYKDLFQFH